MIKSCYPELRSFKFVIQDESHEISNLINKNMISLLRGKIEFKNEKYLIIDVSGVGYKVFCLIAVLDEAMIGAEIKLFTHLHVREDALELYGFLDSQELDFFEKLISISGIGPKAALSILSLAPVNKIKEAIITDREEFLTRISGIGTKMAKKIILELKDKLPKSIEGISDASVIREEIEVIDALISLGYREREARDVMKKIDKDIKGTGNMIREALKYLGKK